MCGSVVASLLSEKELTSLILQKLTVGSQDLKLMSFFPSEMIKALLSSRCWEWRRKGMLFWTWEIAGVRRSWLSGCAAVTKSLHWWLYWQSGTRPHLANELIKQQCIWYSPLIMSPRNLSCLWKLWKLLQYKLVRYPGLKSRFSNPGSKLSVLRGAHLNLWTLWNEYGWLWSYTFKMELHIPFFQFKWKEATQFSFSVWTRHKIYT